MVDRDGVAAADGDMDVRCGAEKLVLTRVWELGDALDGDPGGFGRVFQANSPDGVRLMCPLIRGVGMLGSRLRL